MERLRKGLCNNRRTQKKKNTDQLDENPKMNHLPVTLYT